MKGNVLIVDDDATLRRALVDRLQFWGHAVTEARGGNEALAVLGKREFDLVLLDLAMPDMAGMDVLRALNEAARPDTGLSAGEDSPRGAGLPAGEGSPRGAGLPADIVVLTAHGSIEAAVEALQLGAVDFLLKPANFEVLQKIIERSLEKRRLERVNRALTERVGAATPPLFIDSPAMSQLAETAERAAKSNAPVLITGESGAGKQVMAEFIHRKSQRQAGPFIYVNCVAISDQLIESTLFGHEKGAFTGAVAQKKGQLEAAHGGTAFLDEVGDISPQLQAKLLHFLESGQFERLGGTRTITVDCRIVAATNRDLEGAMREQKFREDLYYRLNVIRLQVPPLRERRADIPALARCFLDREAAQLKRPFKLAPRTLEMLSAYHWPGNVRQLHNAIRGMAAMAPSDTLTPDLLPAEILAPSPGPAPDDADLGYKEATRRFQREFLRRALARTGGNQKQAAELLGLQRTYLNRLMRLFGLQG